MTHTENTNERPDENQIETCLKVGDIANLENLSSMCMNNPILTNKNIIITEEMEGVPCLEGNNCSNVIESMAAFKKKNLVDYDEQSGLNNSNSI